MALLSDLKVAILAEDGVNQAELAGPREALEKAGISVSVVSSRPVEVKATTTDDWDVRIKVDRNLNDISADEFEALIIPGGLWQTDGLKSDNLALNVVWKFFTSGKIVAAIERGVQMLIGAGIVQGRQVSSTPSCEAEVIAAGGVLRDQRVVADNGMITCRDEKDLEFFNKCFLDELRQGIPQRTVAAS